MIRNSHATGDVEASHNTVGGLVGSNYDDLAWTTVALPRNAISGSTASGTVTTTGNNVGGLVGWNNGTISDSAARNPSVMGAHSIGGLVGQSNDNQDDGGNLITGSVATASVTGTATNVGGLVGWNNGPISGSAALNPSVMGTSLVGGLVGQNYDAQADGSNPIVRSVATGSVTGTSDNVGGLVGWNNGPISDSAARNPSVSGASWVGGLVGVNKDAQADGSNPITRSSATASVTGTGINVGGLVGQGDGPISDSSATGSVTSTAPTSNQTGGLVGYNSGVIRDSYASGAVRSGASGTYGGVGGLVGLNLAAGEVIDSRADGAVGAVSADYVGGLVGNNNGAIAGSVATGAVTGNASSRFLGGLAGSNLGSISGSATTGAVSGGSYLGGLVGFNGGSGGSKTITESWASGAVTAIADATVSGSGTRVGGLTGHNDGLVGASFATGNVTGVGAAGGLIGHNQGPVIATYATGNVTVSDNASCTGTCPKVAGGIIGIGRDKASTLVSNVEASYSTGSVSGPSTHFVGGLAGTAERATDPAESAIFTDSYWDTDTSGQTLGVSSDDEDQNGAIDGSETATAGVTGKTTSALKTPTGYAGIFVDWNVMITGITARTGGPWDFGGTTDYPLLRGPSAPPSFPAGTVTLSVPEERPAGTAVGSPLTATDSEGDAVTYRLIGADGAYFSINGTTGQLLTKDILDYENPADGNRDNRYEVMVQARDGTSVAFRTVSVSVTDAIDNLTPPTVTGMAAVTVAENSTAVATYQAQDPDGATSTFAWSLGGTDAAAFTISAGGVLTFATPPDYEAPADANGDYIYEVTVQVDDGGMTGALDVTVTVLDVDEPPVIEGDVRATIEEGTAAFVTDYFATDPEGAVVSWETLAGPDERYFELDIGGGLSFVDAPDHEARANNVYTVIVRAADASLPPNIGELTVTVTITNINEEPAVEGPETIDVNEGHAGTLGTYRRVDPEGSLTNWGTLSSPAALGGSDADRFRFDKQTGQLTFAAPPDFEDGRGQYDVTVEANDGELDSFLFVTVNVANVEEPGTLTFDRRQPVVGQETTATLTDPDNVVGAATWTWQRSTSRSSGWTEIPGANSSTYTAVTDDSSNYLRATVAYDDGFATGKTLQAITEFTTATARGTNAAPMLPNTAVTIELPENALPGRNVGAPVLATDSDNDPISYSLSGDSEFVIDQKTGQIKVALAGAFDFDAGQTSYTVTVTAADGFGGTDTVGVTITIANVAEPPVAEDDVDLPDEDTQVTIDVLLNDSDPEDQTSELLLTVVTQPRNGRAMVTQPASPGDNRTITYEPSANYNGADSFTYRVTDPGGRPSNVATVALTIYPVNDAPTFASPTAALLVSASARAGDNVGAPVTATDIDEGDTLTYSHSGIDAASFVIDRDSGQIAVAGSVTDITMKTTYMVTVTVADEEGATASIDVTITVTAGPVVIPPVVIPPVIPPSGGGGGGGGGGFAGGFAGGGGSGGSSGPSPSDVDFEWTVQHDIDDLDGGHGSPSGLWSDGTTLWILENGDGTDDAVYAYDLASGERVEDREFELDNTNRAPRGVWSDRTVIWVSDSGRNSLFAHDLESGERLPERDIALAARNRAARGIWSGDGTMWVLDGGKDSVFAYDLASGDLLAEYELVSANSDAHGIWSDETTVWVSDHGAKRLFAYRLPVPDAEEVDGEDLELERVRDEEFPNTVLSRASNNSPRGLWSDGDVMYVVDASDGKVYTYNMPDAIDARLASLSLSGVDIGEFSPNREEYEGVVDDGVTVTTVEAAAAQDDAVVVIDPPDADEAADGRQVAVGGGAEITVTVTSADGSRNKTYRVLFEETGPSASCLRGAINEGFSLVVSEGGSIDDLVACAEGRNVTALYTLDGGEYVSYILGAPGPVNEGFDALYADGLPSLTPLIAKSEGPPSPSPESGDVPFGPDCLRGEIVEGFNLVLSEGGSVGELEACAEGVGLAALYALSDGVWVSYILGAPELVNRAFAGLFADGVPAVTPLVARSDSPLTASADGGDATEN